MLYSGVAAITDGLCWFQLYKGRFQQLSLCHWRNWYQLCMMLLQVWGIPDNPSEPACCRAICRHSALTCTHRLYVDDCAHACNILVSLPASAVILAPHTVSGWEGSKTAISLLPRQQWSHTLFLTPNPPTCSVHSRAVVRGAGATTLWGWKWAVEHQLKHSSIFAVLIIWEQSK